MKKLNSRWREQVEFICGSAFEDFFGLTRETRSKIKSEIEIIFHSAATVKLVDELDIAFRTNTVGTIGMIKFARECQNLRAFVFVSSAYSHLYKLHLEEKYYATPINVQEMYNFLNIREEEFKRIRTKEILRDWKIDCTYSLSKAVAENYVRDCGNIPIGIIRPSMSKFKISHFST